jgi:Flp pilus assembly protein TadG
MNKSFSQTIVFRGHWSANPSCASRTGAAAVEMAIICPVVILFALATTDLGRVAYTYMAVSNGARCGAEYGGQHTFTPYTQASWQSQIRQAIDAEMQGVSGYDPSKLQAAITTTIDSDGLNQVLVDVTYPFSTIVNWPGLPSYVLIDHRVEMRQTQ